MAGYGLGADDYVRKPFGAAELRAKVAAHLRRERRPRSHALSFGEVRIDLGARGLAVGGEGRTAHAHRVRHLRVPRPPPRAGHEPARRSAEAVLGWESDARRRGPYPCRSAAPGGNSPRPAPIRSRPSGGWGTSAALRTGARGRGGMPLSFVIARYFAYAFAAVATAWLASFMALSAAINAGFVYEASWGPANTREVAEGLARDGVCGQQDVPTAYRYLILNKDGYVLMTDLEGTRLEDATEMARAALAADPGTVEIEGGGSGLTYAAFPLKSGGALRTRQRVTCRSGVLGADLAGLLPNPQKPLARRRRGGKRARARARGTPREPRDLAQDGAARGGGAGASARGSSTSRSAAPTCAR